MLFALLVAFLSLIALMIIHEFGHFIIAKKFGVKVEEFGIGYPPRIFGKKFGQTIYSINLIPLGAFVKIYGEEGGIDDYRSFSNLAIWKRTLIVLGGVIAFWIAAIVLFSIVFWIGASIPVGDQDVQGAGKANITVMDVQEGSPAVQAGIKKGDEIISFKSEAADVKINKLSEFQELVNNYKGTSVTLTLNRQGQNINVDLTPRIIYPENQGPLGVVIERVLTVIEKHTWYEAPIKGTVYTLNTTWTAAKGLYGIFAGLFSGKGMPEGAEFAGPVGITIFLARATDFGAGFFLYFIASISVFIALFNIFPIPALDGGKLLFLTIEKLIKRPVPVKLEQTLTIVFFFLLISMAIFVTIKFDVPRVIDFWKAGLYR